MIDCFYFIEKLIYIKDNDWWLNYGHWTFYPRIFERYNYIYPENYICKIVSTILFLTTVNKSTFIIIFLNTSLGISWFFTNFEFYNLIASSAIIKTVITGNISNNSDKETPLLTFFIFLHRIVTKDIYQLRAARTTLIITEMPEMLHCITLLGNISHQGFHSGRRHKALRECFHLPE